MILKVLLQLDATQCDLTDETHCMDVTMNIANIDDVKVSYDRQDLGAVTKKVSSDFQFVGDTRDALVKYYLATGLTSKGAICIQGAQNDWSYRTLWECPLDFSTISFDEYKCSVNCIESDASALIKAHKSTEYEFQADALGEGRPLDYEGANTQEDQSVLLVGTGYEGDNDKYIYIDDEELMPTTQGDYSTPLVVLNAQTTDTNYNTYREFTDIDNYLLFAPTQDVDIIIDFSAMNMHLQHEITYIGGSIDQEARLGWSIRRNVGYVDRVYTDNEGNCTFKGTMHKWLVGDTIYGNDVISMFFTFGGFTASDFVEIVGAWKYKIHLHGGDRMKIWFTTNFFNSETFEHDNKLIMNNTPFSVIWQESSTSSSGTIRIPNLIKPITLLRALVHSMGGDTTIGAEIDDADDSTLHDTYILPAECARRLAHPMARCKFNQFCDFMQSVFGYVYRMTKGNTSHERLMNMISTAPIFTETASISGAIEDNNLKNYIDYNIYFIVSLRCFVAMFTDRFDHTYYTKEFEGFERYQTKDGQGNFSVRDDVFFKCISSRMMMMKDTGFLGLKSAVYGNVMQGRYAERLFGGNVSKDSITIRSSTYIGNVSETSILFYPVTNQFVYKKQNMYYASWNGSQNYNNIADGNISAKDGYYTTAIGNDKYILIDGWMVQYDGTTDTIDCDVVEFIHRSKAFDTNATPKILQLTNEFSCEIDDGNVYASVDIGYEPQEYDRENTGKLEFNFTNHYTTGATLTDNKLELVSPFRADSYGIEELVYASFKENEKDKDDKDLFIVHCGLNTDGTLKLYKNQRYTGVPDNTTAYNGEYIPMRCVQRNAQYLKMTADVLKYTSTDGNNNASYNEISVNSDLPLNIEGLFKPNIIKIKTNDLNIPQDLNALITFDYGNYTWEGFILSVDIKLGKEEVLEYELMMHKVTDNTLNGDRQADARRRKRRENPAYQFGDYGIDFGDDFSSETPVTDDDDNENDITENEHNGVFDL